MDNNFSSKEKEIVSSAFDTDMLSDDYENLINRLKSIKESITLLEKNLLVH